MKNIFGYVAMFGFLTAGWHFLFINETTNSVICFSTAAILLEIDTLKTK